MGFVFFFSSRRRHTRWTGDWSSDVCSSDLRYHAVHQPQERILNDNRDPAVSVCIWEVNGEIQNASVLAVPRTGPRSEERRVGKECRCGGSPGQENKKVEVVMCSGVDRWTYV